MFDIIGFLHIIKYMRTLKEIEKSHIMWKMGAYNGTRLVYSQLSREEQDLFCGGDLSHSDLSYADLSRADLEGLMLENAFLEYTNFKDSNLSFADLENANVEGANFDGAILDFTDLDGTILKRGSYFV